MTSRIMTPQATAGEGRGLGKCASQFQRHDECGLVISGCCAREMLRSAGHVDGGVEFPMDLNLSGNPFVNALEAKGLVRVCGRRTIADPKAPPPPAASPCSFEGEL